MTDSSLTYLNKSGDWELGTGPSIVVVDTGVPKSLSTATLQKDAYAFFFNQKGLMARTRSQNRPLSPLNRWRMFWQGVILVAIPNMPSELMPDSLNISML